MSGPYVWGESKYLGTAQEEFDVATGYWKKWQRCKEERDELLHAAKMAQETIGWITDASKERYVKETLQKAIEKVERT